MITDLTLSYVEVVPSGATGDLPLVITLHGRGADAHDLADLAPSLDGGGGYRFVFPNAPAKWEFMPGYAQGYTWFDGWPPVGSSFQRSREQLMKFVGEVRERYATPWSKMVITGFSQGALMALDVVFRLPEQIAGVVAMSGALHEEELADVSERRELPMLIVHGAQDEVIPVQAARHSRMALEGLGLKVEYQEFPMGHWVTPEELKVVGDFVRRVLT